MSQVTGMWIVMVSDTGSQTLKFAKRITHTYLRPEEWIDAKIALNKQQSQMSKRLNTKYDINYQITL